jgi:heme/flavin dehydrogenase (mycofactocin system)
MGVSARDNVEAFGSLGFAPRAAGRSSSRHTATTVMGRELSLPVLISPVGVQAVEPGAEATLARAAAARGTAIGLSAFAATAMEDVAAANPHTFFQLFWMGGKGFLSHLIERARTAGVAGLIVTLDWSFAHGRDWGSPRIPESLNLSAMTRLVPSVLRHPRWLLGFAKAGRLPDLTVPNMAEPGGRPPTFFGAYGTWLQTAPPTWDDVAWLRRQWEGPFMLKGIMRVDDARRAVDAGYTAISVSNHGGNDLDGTPAPIRALPAITGAVGDKIEVVLDGGIRRGGDVVKALALGARAVMIGRAALWGLAANGQAGVENVLDIMQSGVTSALLALGHSSVQDLSSADVLVPPGFTRCLGCP